MEIRTIAIKADIPKPISILHLTDLHLTLCDESEAPEHIKHAHARSECFAVDGKLNPAEQTIRELLQASGEHDLVLLTGDIIDFPSGANIRALKALLAGRNCLYCMGNHDWNYPEDYPFGLVNWDYSQSKLYAQALAKTAHLFRDFQTGFDIKTVGGVKVIAINNSDYRFTNEQYLRLRDELEQAVPTVVAFHIPLYAPTLMPDTVAYWALPIVCGGDADVHKDWGYRPDPVTLSTAELLGSNPNVLAVISGHLHFFHTDILPGGNTQYITALSQRGNATVFRIGRE